MPKDTSIWSSKYVMGGITGFIAGGTAYQIGGISGLLSAVVIISLSVSWYHAGKKEANEHHIQFLKKLRDMGKVPSA